MEAIGSEAPRRIVHDVLRPHKAVLRQLLSDLRPAVLLLHHVEPPPLFRLLYPLYFKVLQYLLGYHYTQYLSYQFVVHLAFSFPTAMMPQHIAFQFTQVSCRHA